METPTARGYYYDGDSLMIECGRCHIYRKDIEFDKRKNGMLGRRNVCKKCRKEEYLENRDEILLQRKIFYDKNKEKKKEYQNNYYKNNADYIKNQHKEYRDKNKEHITKRRKEYYKENEQKIVNNILEYTSKKSLELGFDWASFHNKARRYAKKYNLLGNVCMVCGDKSDIHMHHPSYDSYDNWSDVVFVCKKCHHNIHAGNIESPNPINLIQLNENAHKLLDDKGIDENL